MEHTTTTTSAAPTSGGHTLTADDPRAVFATSVATARRVIAGTTSDQLPLSTPCDDYDVRTLLGHLVAVIDRVAAVGRGVPVTSTPQIVTGVADDGWSSAFVEAAHGVQSVWQDDALLAGTYVLPWGTKTGPDLLLTYTNEVSVHTWDLAAATGQAVAWHEPTLVAAYEVIRAALPAERRRVAFEAMRANMPAHLRDAPAPFGEVVPVEDGATLIDQLVAWNGRRPDWHR